MSRNSARRGKPSEGDEAVDTYSDSTRVDGLTKYCWIYAIKKIGEKNSPRRDKQARGGSLFYNEVLDLGGETVQDKAKQAREMKL